MDYDFLADRASRRGVVASALAHWREISAGALCEACPDSERYAELEQERDRRDLTLAE